MKMNCKMLSDVKFLISRVIILFYDKNNYLGTLLSFDLKRELLHLSLTRYLLVNTHF